MRKGLIVMISLLLLTLLSFALYIYVYKPLDERREQLKTELQMEKKLLQTLQSKPPSDDLRISLIELQKRVPVQPFVEQFLLDIEKAEVVSNSEVLSLTFQEGENVEGPPTPIQKLTVNISVRSPSYFALEQFIDVLERSKRIVSVDSLSFTGYEEWTTVMDEVPELSYSLTVSTFYAPELRQWIEQLPPLDLPQPSEKRNPFPSLTEQ
ncbi:pilus assembly protein PilO [Anoxybacillus ayderensis]|uniref:type 4a pilus biogenesis protein PilO n=1 Tax=Anoxybacillus sp. ST70 TaxID=2864180 RepID=UPI0003159D3C|nr:type 4a pilus biogenesis protein PilO [Anoxybacillus sp. ST70]AXM89622.1 pilus assembly protein PilO [Anoxybacillus ayderensis G10]MBW9217763.1 type 4a pilus biogenesis protein PilO [Anoxybacillus sp. ST70]THD16581.1 pilus assembly protein PilO [Anoxybacillus ayderensis]